MQWTTVIHRREPACINKTVFRPKGLKVIFLVDVNDGVKTVGVCVLGVDFLRVTTVDREHGVNGGCK